MALIDQIMPLTTLVIFMGGNSGQMIVNILRKHESFSDYDHVPIDRDGGFQREIYMPFIHSQYATRLGHFNMHDVIGPMSWMKSEDNRSWLREQTEDWMVRAWKRWAAVSLDEIIADQKRIAIPSHLDPRFASWILPEAKKIFVTDRDSYFAIRADKAKNPDKHPKDTKQLVRYCAERTLVHRIWNTTEFDHQNSMVLVRSDLITEDRLRHVNTLRSLMSFHGIELDLNQEEDIWGMTLDYLEKQRKSDHIR